MRGNSRTAALTLVLLWAVPALAEDVTLSGTVTWDVVNAQSGYVLVFGLSEVGFSAQVPLDVDAGGHSGTYSLAVPPDDYVVYVNVGACPGIENGEYCPTQMTLNRSNPVAVASDTVFDIHPPAGSGPAHVSGRVSLEGGSIASGEANLTYVLSDGESEYFGYDIVPFGPDGEYAATVGSGTVSAVLTVHQSDCVLDQVFFAPELEVAAGDDVAFEDQVGQAYPLAPAPGKILVKTGINGFPDGRTFISTVGGGFGEPDCAGGGNTPTTPGEFGVPAGEVFLTADGFDEHTDISVGTYELRAMAQTGTFESGRYNYTTRFVDVLSNQTTTVDYRFDPAFVRGKWKFDWGTFNPQFISSFVVNAHVPDVPGHVESGSVTQFGLWTGEPGILSYEFKLPINPSEQWRFSGITFFVDFADGTFQNIHVIPEATFADDYPDVPALSAGKSKIYNFDALMDFGMGSLIFAPTGFAQGVNLNGATVETISAGTRNATLGAGGSFDSPSAHATPMQGRSTLTASWYDGDFISHEEELDVDVRRTETVTLSESAPRIDDLRPLPGTVCVHSVDVTGRASDPNGIASLKVNGKTVTVKANGSFKTTVNVPSGNSTLEVKAVDTGGHHLTRSRPLRFSQNCQ
jgi:hypothetical protein